MDFPRLRAVEVVPLEEGTYGLRDPYRYTEKILIVPQNILFILSLFDGRHSILDIQCEYTRRFGDLLYSQKVQEIVDQLDGGGFLESDQFTVLKKRVDEEFRRADTRHPSHAGTAYAGESGALREQLAGFFAWPGKAAQASEGSPSAGSLRGRLEGIIAPHIDLARGGACFAASYSRLAEDCTANTFVILGISHVDTRNRFVLTEKDFDTPLGVLKTDRGFVRALAGKCSRDLFEDEIVHRHEHSLEFQVLFLKYLSPGREDIRIVPVLCSSIDDLLLSPSPALEDAGLAEFLRGLKELLAERGTGACLVAGVDLSHVGPRFGDREPLTPQLADAVRREDEKMLQRVLARDAEGFYQSIRQESDRRRVCGFPAIYLLLNLLRRGESRLLKYEQAVDAQAQSLVSFASVAFYRD